MKSNSSAIRERVWSSPTGEGACFGHRPVKKVVNRDFRPVLVSQFDMIQKLFPTTISYALLQKSWKKLNAELLDESYKFAEIDEEGQKWSQKNYPGGYTSYGSISNLHQVSTTFETLQKQIDKHVAHFAKHLEMDISARELKMTSCWVNIMSTQVVHSFHLHPLSVISGTYYVQIPPGSAGLKFEDPRATAFMASPPRKAKARLDNQRYYTLTPQIGHVVLFESWLRHEVPPHLSHHERVSISFNYDWV